MRAVTKTWSPFRKEMNLRVLIARSAVGQISHIKRQEKERFIKISQITKCDSYVAHRNDKVTNSLFFRNSRPHV